MRILAWHVHGSWMTAFVQGAHEYLIPLLPDRGPDGRGRALTWDWPAGALEVRPEMLRRKEFDAVVLQRPAEIELVERWTGRRPGRDVPAVYVEHNAPGGPAAATVHPLAGRADIPVVHVTAFNQLMWDCGRAPTTVVEHGVVDPGYRYTGEAARLAAVVNEPVRRTRVAGTDLLLQLAERVPVDVFGMGVRELADARPDLADRLQGRLHENLPQAVLHARLARHRAYLHPFRWTSLGLALIEAMALGLPVLGLCTTDAPAAVPPGTGVLSNDLDRLTETARRWLADPEEARQTGLRARQHAVSRYGLGRFLSDWDALLKEVVR